MGRKDNRPYSIHSPLWTGLAKVIEEAGEVIQVGGKIITAGRSSNWGLTTPSDASDLVSRLQNECADLLAALDFMIESSPWMDSQSIANRRQIKLDRFRRHGYGSYSPPPRDCD